MNDFKGYSTPETYEVAVWIQNNPAFYYLAQNCHTYGDFVQKISASFPAERIGRATPDGVRWNDPQIDRTQINALLRDIKNAI